MREFVQNCREHMPVDVLSDWRDDALGSELTQRVAAHLPTCRACQAYLHAYEADALRLRRLASPDLEAEAWQLVQQRIRQTPANRGQMRRVFASGSAVLAVLIIVGLFALLLKNTAGHPGPVTIVPTATNSRPPTATVQGNNPTTTPVASQNWTDIPALNFGKSIAFAPGDPQTGYVCGNNPPGGTSAPLQIAVTHDGGQTWGTPIITNINQVACRIFVNPGDPQELAMNTSGCWLGCSGSGQYDSDLYRSFDGGQTWQKVTFPSANVQAAMSAPVWVKGALLVYTAPAFSDSITPFQRGAHSVAVSINKGPLLWANDGSLFAGITDKSVEIDTALAYNGIYVVDVNGTAFKTTDFGNTWARLSFPNNIHLTDVTADGTTLLGINPANQQHARSSDGGQSWTPFAVPTNTTRIVTTPDGTYYALQDDLNTASVKTIEKQSPGSQNWTPIADIDPTKSPTLTWATVSSDANGHPAHLWSTEATNLSAHLADYAVSHQPASSIGYAPGIAEHAP